MEANGKIGTVKMKILRALKRMFEEYTIDRIIGGSILKRSENLIDNVLKNREQGIKQSSKVEKDNLTFGKEELEEIKNRGQEVKQSSEVEKDNSLFGQKVVEGYGIIRKKSGEYVETKNQEIQKQSQEDEMVL